MSQSWTSLNPFEFAARSPASEGGGSHGFTFLSHLPVIGGVIPEHILGAALVAILILFCTWVARLQLDALRKTADEGIVPSNRLTFQNFFEIIAEKLYGFVESVLGEHEAPIYYPLIASLFIFIFTCNAIGLIPGFLPPTQDLNTTLGLGLFVFVAYNAVGIKAHGWGYLKHFFGPVVWLGPLLFVIELVSHAVRPLSLGLRLRGNMYGDHLVLGLFSQLTPWFVPIVFMGMGLFISFIQAFVFCLLTMVYISLSTAHDH